MRRVRLIASALVLLLLTLSFLPHRAAQAEQPLFGEDEAIAVLQEYQIVRGDTSGNLNLDARLTRAQAATIFVRAMKADDLASLLEVDAPFSDVKGHWAAKEIAVAERMGLMKGDGDGQFRPEADITYAEIYTVLLRMLKREPTGPWSPETIMRQANLLPIVPTGTDGRAAAVRRTIFWALAGAISSVPVDGHPNLLRQYIDQVPPILQIDQVSAMTADPFFVVSGSVVGGTRVLVNRNPAVMDRTSGRFTYKAAVEPGTNTLVVEASDAAGNTDVKQVVVERQAVIARLSVTGPKVLTANSSTKLTLEAKDSRGNSIPIDSLEAQMTGDVATYSLSTSTLVTGNKSGKGTLTLVAGKVRAIYSFEVVAPSTRASAIMIMPVNGDRPLALNKEETVLVQVVDSGGKVVTEDFGRGITLSTTGEVPLTITPVSPITEKGIATFKVVGSSVGQSTLTASTLGLEPVSKPLEVLTARRIMLVPSIKSLMPDGTSSVTIKAVLQDELGRAVANDTGTDLTIELTSIGTDSVLTNPYLTIPKGRSDSGAASAKLTAGIASGISTIQGSFRSSHSYAIQTLQFPVDTPLPGVKLELTSSSSSVLPGGQVTVKVRVLDGTNRLVSNGSYAFQVTASTSNNDPNYQGLPEGVSVSFLNSPYYPVNDGRPVTDQLNDPYAIIGRTDKGEAIITLRYTRSGIVNVKAALLPATGEGYNPTSGMGPASASTGLFVLPVDVYFQGTPARIELTVNSVIGTELKGGALGGSGTMTLRARVVDTFGATVPGYSGIISVTRLTSSSGVTSVVGVREKAAVNGVVDYTLQAFDSAGVDLYQVTAGTLQSDPITIAVRKAKALQPSIAAIRGVKEGGLSPVTGFVGPEADYMDIQLNAQVVDERELQYWVQARVYREGESTPFFTQPVDLRSPVPLIRIPRSLLKIGQYRYSVVVYNGFGDTTRSLTLDDTTFATVATYNNIFLMQSALFDAETGKLYLRTSGLSQLGVIDKSKLSIVKGQSVVALDSGQVSVVTPISASQVVLNLGSLAEAIDPELFYGAVSLVAQAGWYVGDSGSTVARSFTVPVTPMAMIAGGALDLHGKRLYLNGEGFLQGTLQWNLVQVRTSDTDSVALRPGTSTGFDQILQLTDTQAIIGLSDTTYNAIMALTGPNLYLTASLGWIQTTGTVARGSAITAATHVLLLRVLANSASYDPASDTLTIRASGGFQGMLLNPGSLVVRVGPGGAGWTPALTPSLTATEDTILAVTLAPEDATAFESTFGGKNIYVNTLPGWLTDPQGRQVLPVSDYSILLLVPEN